MLPSALLQEIEALIDRGDELLERDQFSKALEAYRRAVAHIPDPKYLHDVSLSAHTALGEGFFFAGYPDEALRAFGEALKAPGGVENPLLHLRVGQSYFEIGQHDRAADALMMAYALGGREIFDGEDGKYLSFLATRIEL